MKTQRSQAVDSKIIATLDRVSKFLERAETQKKAQQAADAAAKTNFEKICEEQKRAYDARNPHKQ